MFSSDLAIDLGTANTLVYVVGKGIVLNEPSIVAVDRKSRQAMGFGADAKEMIGRTPANMLAVRPLRDGVIADFELAEEMLTYFIRKANKRHKLLHPRIAIGIPSETTEVEKRAVLDSTYRAKASEVHLVERAMVAALGAGLPVTEPGGNMVVDIGGGTTDIAVISLSGIVYSKSLRMAGNQMDDAISEHVKRKHGLLIGERTAEKIKLEIGTAYQDGTPRTMAVKGRDMVYGLPKTITLEDDEIRSALTDCVNSIVSAVRVALEKTPPELSGDIMERGIILTGGGSLLKNLDERIRFETGMPVLVANEPLASVVLGTGMMLEDFKLLRKMCLN
jgi:rod shape-determining protein MreB